jgi:large subunit ribosomal protein L13
MSTYSAKPTDVQRQWFVIDASQAPMGRIATHAANLLMGKGKPQFTKHIDCGDFVIIINADKTQVTGDKLKKKIYYRHSGFPGGIKSASFEEKMEKDSTFPITNAVRGMLPVNKLRANRLARLKVYSDENHNHSAQKPVIINIKDIK